MFSGRDPIYNSVEWMVGHDVPLTLEIPDIFSSRTTKGVN